MSPVPAVVLAEAPFSDISGPEVALILAVLFLAFLVAMAIVAAVVVVGVGIGRGLTGRPVGGRPPSAAVAVATMVAAASALRVGPVWALVVGFVLGLAISATLDRREGVEAPDEPDGPDVWGPPEDGQT